MLYVRTNTLLVSSLYTLFLIFRTHTNYADFTLIYKDSTHTHSDAHIETFPGKKEEEEEEERERSSSSRVFQCTFLTSTRPFDYEVVFARGVTRLDSGIVVYCARSSLNSSPLMVSFSTSTSTILSIATRFFEI